MTTPPNTSGDELKQILIELVYQLTDLTKEYLESHYNNSKLQDAEAAIQALYPTPKVQASSGELPPELFNELWETSLILKDTRQDAEAWYHRVKSLISTHYIAKTEVASLYALIDELADPKECWYGDNGHLNGSCLAHDWVRTDLACPHKRAKELRAALGLGEES